MGATPKEPSASREAGGSVGTEAMPSFFSQAAPGREFQPRAERLDYSFAVEFRGEEMRVSGSCQNINEAGMMARFRRPLEVWTNGDLWCNTGALILEVRVRIVRVNDREAGMVFRFRNEREREEMRSVVALASRHTGVAGGPPPF